MSIERRGPQNREGEGDPGWEDSTENVGYLLAAMELPEDQPPIEEVPETEEEELEDYFFGIDMEERLTQIESFLASREDTRDDHDRLDYLARIFWLDQSKEEAGSLVGIYEDRGFNIDAVEGLLLFTSWRKQKLSAKGQIVIEDLQQVGQKHLTSSVKEKLIDLTVDSLAKLGFDKEGIKTACEVDNQKELRAICLLGWLADQSFMREFNERIRITMTQKKAMGLTKLMDMASREIDSQIHLHIKNQRKEFDWSIDFERAAAITKSRLLITAKGASDLLFMGKYHHSKNSGEY